MNEHRLAHEFRVAGRTLSGAAMTYGAVSPDFQERFAPGALQHSGRIDINLQHDPDLVVVRGAMLTDGPRELRVRAELAEGSAALQLVKRGALNGFSIEFHAKAERREAGIRVIERAELVGLALVDRGAYPAAKAEIRRRKKLSKTAIKKAGRVLRSTIPYDLELSCECLKSGGGAACIPMARFSKAAGDGMAEAIDSAKAEGRDVLAVQENLRDRLEAPHAGRFAPRRRTTHSKLRWIYPMATWAIQWWRRMRRPELSLDL